MRSCCLTGFIGAFVGNTVVSHYIQKYKKTYAALELSCSTTFHSSCSYVIVALLTGILTLSVCLLAYSGISNLVSRALRVVPAFTYSSYCR
jgi:hypothetical protein